MVMSTVPPDPPTKAAIESALVVEIRRRLSNPNVSAATYASLSELLTRLTGIPASEAAFPPKC